MSDCAKPEPNFAWSDVRPVLQDKSSVFPCKPAPNWVAIDAAVGPRIPSDTEAPPGCCSAEQYADKYGVSRKRAAEILAKSKALQSGLFMRRGRITRLYWPM
jgi:hypothetical protein